MRQSLPAIIKVKYVECELLPTDITLKAISGATVEIYASLQNVPLDGEALCETETTFDNNSQVQKTQLVFYTLDELPTHKHLAFVISTANNETFIIGTKEAPFPTFKISKSTGSPSGDPAVKKYEVTFKGKRTLIPCII